MLSIHLYSAGLPGVPREGPLSDGKWQTHRCLLLPPITDPTRISAGTLEHVWGKGFVPCKPSHQNQLGLDVNDSRCISLVLFALMAVNEMISFILFNNRQVFVYHWEPDSWTYMEFSFSCSFWLDADEKNLAGLKLFLFLNKNSLFGSSSFNWYFFL